VFVHIVNVILFTYPRMVPHDGAVCEIVHEVTEWVCVRLRSGDGGCRQKLPTATFLPIYSTV
jgi:hypothetical protein